MVRDVLFLLQVLGEDTKKNVLFRAFNGPELGETDHALKTVLDQHFARKGGRCTLQQTP